MPADGGRMAFGCQIVGYTNASMLDATLDGEGVRTRPDDAASSPEGVGGMNNEAFQARVLETLESQGHLLVSLVQAVSAQQSQIEMANATLEEIVELLTPEEQPKTGPSLAETLMELANRIERQTALIRDLTKVVVQATDP